MSSGTVRETSHSFIEYLVGKLGAAEMNARMVSFEENGNIAIFRCNLESVEKLRAALALMTHIEGNPVAVMVLRSSGTIRALNGEFGRR